MLPGVTTAATTGEHGTGFAGAANAGTEISAPCESGDEYFHDTSPYLDRCRLWHQRIGRSAGACRPKMPTLVLPARDRDHKLRTIQNDSDCPASGRNVLARGRPTPWRGLGLACFIELSLDGQHDSRDELCRSVVILGRESCGRAAHQTATRLRDVERLSCGRGRASAL